MSARFPYSVIANLRSCGTSKHDAGTRAEASPRRANDAFSRLDGMAVLRMDNVGIVFDDLDAAVAFFVELGLELEGRMTVEGEWSDRVVGLEGQRVDIAMLRTPDGHSKLELMSYQKPTVISPEPKNAPPNTLGIRRLMFAVDDIQDTIDRLQTHGAELVGEVVRYEDMFLLCYLRGPEGVIVALAEELR
jgi:catechol 2,3-dioxygenase-like lactoylglutathione lyase family enzyme